MALKHNINTRFIVLFAIVLGAVFGFAVYRAVAEVGIHEGIIGSPFGYAVRVVLDQVFRYLALAVGSASLLTFSLTVTPRDLHGGGRLIATIGPSLAIIVAVAVLNALWIGILGPRNRAQIEQIEFRTLLATESRASAEAAIAAGRGVVAREHALLYLQLVGETTTSRDLVTSAENTLTEQQQRSRRRARSEPAPDTLLVPEIDSLTVAELVVEAQEFFSAGDYFSAHYYATRAVQSSRDQRIDARRVQAESLRAIEGAAWRIQEDGERSFYSDKVLAYQTLQAGSDQPERVIEAYYRFLRLEQLRPDDPDVQRYAAVARRQLDTVAFFVDTAISYQALPAAEQISYATAVDDQLLEFLVVDRIVRVREGDFFYGVEIMRIDLSRPAQPIVVHARAPFGKVIEGMLVLRAVRESGAVGAPENVIEPEFLVGDSLGRFPFSIELYATVDQLVRLAAGPDGGATTSLPQLIASAGVLADLGESEQAVYQRIARHAVAMCSALLFGVLGIALGWRFRAVYARRPPFYVLILVPAVPLGLYWLQSTVGFVIDSGIRYAIPAWGSVRAILALGALLVGTVVLSLAMLTRQEVPR